MLIGTMQDYFGEFNRKLYYPNFIFIGRDVFPYKVLANDENLDNFI